MERVDCDGDTAFCAVASTKSFSGCELEAEFLSSYMTGGSPFSRRLGGASRGLQVQYGVEQRCGDWFSRGGPSFQYFIMTGPLGCTPSSTGASISVHRRAFTSITCHNGARTIIIGATSQKHSQIASRPTLRSPQLLTTRVPVPESESVPAQPPSKAVLQVAACVGALRGCVEASQVARPRTEEQ